MTQLLFDVAILLTCAATAWRVFKIPTTHPPAPIIVPPKPAVAKLTGAIDRPAPPEPKTHPEPNIWRVLEDRDGKKAPGAWVRYGTPAWKHAYETPGLYLSKDKTVEPGVQK